MFPVECCCFFWSCCLYIPSWSFCFGVCVPMFLVECFILELASLCSWLIVLFWSWCHNVPSWLFCFGFGIFMFLVNCCFGAGFFMFLVECFVLELASLCSWFYVLIWSWHLHVPSWMFCFGVGVFIFLVECFLLELAFLCSWLNVLFWSWRLYAPG